MGKLCWFILNPNRCLLSGLQSGLLCQERAQFDLPIHGCGQAGATVHSRAPIDRHHRCFVPAQRQHTLQSWLPIGQLEDMEGKYGRWDGLENEMKMFILILQVETTNTKADVHMFGKYKIKFPLKIKLTKTETINTCEFIFYK